MRVKIESDGTPNGTRVLNADTGEKIEGLTKVEWSVELGMPAVAKLEFLLVDITAIGDTDRKMLSVPDVLAQSEKDL